MIKSEYKKQNGFQFIKEMENKYHSINELEKLFEKTNNMKLLVDLQNWKYFKDNHDETIETTKTIVSQNH